MNLRKLGVTCTPAVIVFCSGAVIRLLSISLCEAQSHATVQSEDSISRPLLSCSFSLNQEGFYDLLISSTRPAHLLRQ